MNKNKLKSYAPAARRDFIQAVTDRAHFYGLSEQEIIPVEGSGDVAIIGGRPFPRAVAAQRKKLEERVTREGFNQVMEAVAYTWFNRFLALRFMEIHGYLEHGFRVLSSTGSSIVPEILTHAAHLDLPGLNKQKVIELKLDGSKDAELYRLLLVAQCNALHAAMPFLFEKIEDETELLLPDNLLHSDSLIRKLVTEIDEEDWQEVEIIGWLYQFYISEKKDQVIGKVVKSEDIPAATQLFTPNWIVKYMVQNSLGRKWLATYPNSPLKMKMEYYIEPAEQTAEVNAQLAAITPASLNPEKLTLLDPACGSGHILVEAYDVFKEIYLERGYSNRDFPRLILERNLYGLDIDDRAAQMAGFALLMKARKDDRRILRSDKPVKLNVIAIQESDNITIDNDTWGENANALRDLVDLFKDSKTFGSLIQVPNWLVEKLPVLLSVVRNAISSNNLFLGQTAGYLLPIVEQGKLLADNYDCVVANPPYMGRKFINSAFKSFLSDNFPGCEIDVFSAFMSRNISFSKYNGDLGFMTPMVWMFISSHECIRTKILRETTLTSLVQLEYNASGEVRVPLCTFTINKSHILSFSGSFIRLTEFGGYDVQAPRTLEAIKNTNCGWYYNAKPDDFTKIPGSPVAYWISDKIRNIFATNPSMGEMVDARQGLATADNDRFLRMWHEVDYSNIAFGIKDRTSAMKLTTKWFPHLKGGDFRKWFGNHEWVVNWQNDGDEIRNFKDENGKVKSRPQGTDYYFKECVSWSDVTSSSNSFRWDGDGFIPNVVAPVLYRNSVDLRLFLMAGNNCFYNYISKVLNPTLHFHVGYFATMPFPEKLKNVDFKIVDELISIARSDWNQFETSWYFTAPFLLNEFNNIRDAWEQWSLFCSSQIARMQVLEEQNNQLFVEAYELQEELSTSVSEDQITLARANRESDMRLLISYSIGCMMGRYSLDQPGLVYANNGNTGFIATQYQTFPADDDGIVPVMDMDWFPDDAASRFEEFLKVAWSTETLEENMKFVADSLSPKGGEAPRETIRSYIITLFFKDHLQNYKKRPIYWLFSSGKQRAFECLVYLHRYNESTLSRMRNEYVTPLQGKFSAQADYLASEVNAATSTAERNRLQKQLDTLRKKQVELAAFDDLLRHYADQRISLDLDDGVKVNYGKFGALLAEVKAVTGGVEKINQELI